MVKIAKQKGSRVEVTKIQKDIRALAAKALQIKPEEISGISLIKKGMTNHSFLFEYRGKKYMARIPGEGTERLISRVEEAEVYRILRDKGIADNCLYIDPHSGYKITEYLEPSRVCNPENAEDVSRCMRVLRRFHDMSLKTKHEFSVFGQIDFYESLWDGRKSWHQDYSDTKKRVLSLENYIDAHVGNKTLAHIDAVPDNFLFHGKEPGEEAVYLIDWEYAGMQDPHVDIAMFGIYAGYTKQQMDDLIQSYFEGVCPKEVFIKIYCYVAACGLLWSNWCEYKQSLGVHFDEYAFRQYQYAKDYCSVVADALGKEREKWGIL